MEESTPIVEKPPKSIKIQLHTNISKSNIFTKNTDLSQPTKPKSKTLDIFESKEVKRTCATLKEIENGILIQSGIFFVFSLYLELLRIPKFQNYNPGEPSTKLFIRNLAKTVTQDDFYYLFGHLFKTDEETKEYFLFSLYHPSDRFKSSCLRKETWRTPPLLHSPQNTRQDWLWNTCMDSNSKENHCWLYFSFCCSLYAVIGLQ